jgi:uncharacterized heparinase superfamily protein
MDSGRPPPVAVSQEAHAGCLSFELSWKTHLLVVNCGMPAVNKENWRQVARATAAHSTVTFNDRSSCEFLESRPIRRLLSGTPIIAGPRNLRVTREDVADGARLLASHDGYAREFGVLHNRVMTLSRDGRALDGEDSFAAADGRALPPRAAEEYAIRFHLHPAIKANRLADGRGVILLLPDRELWTFHCYGEMVEIEESVYLAGSDRPRRAVQIVIYGNARKQRAVRWTLRHTPPAAAGARASPAEEPELPL